MRKFPPNIDLTVCKRKLHRLLCSHSYYLWWHTHTEMSYTNFVGIHNVPKTWKHKVNIRYYNVYSYFWVNLQVHCVIFYQFYEEYLIYTTFRYFAPLPSSWIGYHYTEHWVGYCSRIWKVPGLNQIAKNAKSVMIMATNHPKIRSRMNIVMFSCLLDCYFSILKLSKCSCTRS